MDFIFSCVIDVDTSTFYTLFLYIHIIVHFYARNLHVLIWNCMVHGKHFCLLYFVRPSVSLNYLIYGRLNHISIYTNAICTTNTLWKNVRVADIGPFKEIKWLAIECEMLSLETCKDEREELLILIALLSHDFTTWRCNGGWKCK